MNKLLMRLLFAIVLIGAVWLVHIPKVQALACDGWYGHSCWYGYFDNKYDPGINPPGSDVIPGGIQGLTSGDKSGFINKIEGYLNSPPGSDQEHLHTSATFIILSMSNAGNNRAISAAQIADWENRVMNPAIQMRVEFAPFVCGDANTYYQIAEDDIAAGTATTDEGCGASDEMIDFYDTSQPGSPLVYRVRIACGNPLGQLPGLPKPQPQPVTQLKCGTVATDPDDPEVGQPLTVKASVTVLSGANQPITAKSMTIRRQDGTTVIPTLGPPQTNGNTITLATQNYSPPANGWYSVAWSMTVNNVSISCGGDFNPANAFDALTYPFFSVRGDIVSGISFATTTDTGSVPCSAAPHNPKAGISSWNRSGSPDFNGAGSQYAAMAMNYLQGFASDTAVGGGGLDLSFSNSPQTNNGVSSTDVSGSSLFGGMFGSIVECVDYWNTKPDLSAPDVQQLSGVASAANMSGLYSSSGDLELGGGTIQNGSHATVYVDGNVEITGPITYQSTNWTDTNQIPTFKLIVHGSIFIDSGVDNLDGLYVAVPDHYDPSDPKTTANNFVNPQPGTITTCAVRGVTPFQSYDPTSATVGGAMYTNCNSKLTVNGSFIANQLYLDRIGVSSTLATNQPAEEFIQSPEMWLAQASTFDPTTGPRYQAVLGLPPVL